MTPLRWLHITVLPTESAGKMTRTTQARCSPGQGPLSGAPPVAVPLTRVMCHPEASRWPSRLTARQTPVFEAAQATTSKITGMAAQSPGQHGCRI